jgi:hypothetical protein
MTEEIKHEIREVINESLLEAVMEANSRNNKSTKNMILTILQVILAPLIAWLLWNSVEIQKDIVLLRVQVAQANEHLVEHMSDVEQARSSSIVLHHTKVLPNCTACHSIVPAKSSQKKKIISKEDIETNKKVFGQ